MSDKIPTQDDGSPDWEKASNLPVVQTLMRLSYIAALERCAEWHEEQGKLTHARGDWRLSNNHADCANTIRQWIEKEQADG